MFKPKTIRIAAIITILLSLLGLANSIQVLLRTGNIFLGIISWTMMLGASYIGYRLSGYKLDGEAYRKVGLRVYFIVAAFGVLVFAGLLMGFILSAVMLATFWSLKNYHDEAADQARK
jgi:hypothetical protein